MSQKYESNSSFREVAARIRAAKSLAVTTHDRPDGDAMGSSLAIVRMARALGLRAEAVLTKPIDPNVMMLARPGEIRLAPPLPSADEYDIVLLVDTGAWSQLEGVAPWLRSLDSRIVGLDHHARGDAVAGTRIVDVSCASATQVVAGLVDELGVDFAWGDRDGHGSIAEACFAGLATDTGWFRFASADSRVYALASRLLACGVDKEWLHMVFEESERLPRLGATARALSSCRFLPGGDAVLMSLSPEDFHVTGASSHDIGGVVNTPLAVGAVRMSMLLSEQEPGITKCSFRSKPPLDGAPSYDVNEFAARFGGGGHVQAAGARFPLPLAGAIARIEAEFPACRERALGAAKGVMPVSQGRPR
ncbi:MAG: bifunctional oligoribonuclease/PAP phosphatase NrnA [Phycisphaerales bacterium]|nr:bifunctional oligoribonuclease/PAP phosphatase NrnA [Phycisphaerales bacterium]